MSEPGQTPTGGDWNTTRATLAGGDQSRAELLQSFESPDQLFEKLTAKPPEPVEFDWRKAMAGEDTSELEYLNRFSDLGAVRKSWREADRALRESGRVKLPGENATDAEKAEWGKAFGLAEKPDAYEVKVQPPQGYQPSDADKAVLSRAQQRVHDVLAQGGKAPDIINAIHEFYWNEATQAQTSADDRAAELAVETEQDLRNRWGGKYDENISYAVAGAKQFFQPTEASKAGEEFQDFLGLTLSDGHKLGDHPMFLRMFADIGRQFAEDPFFQKMKGDNPGFDPEARKREIMGWRETDPKRYAHADTQAELDRINAGLARRQGQGRAA